MIRDLQSSDRIREHIDELQGDYIRSPDKNLVKQFINFWEQKYWLKLEMELELINN